MENVGEMWKQKSDNGKRNEREVSWENFYPFSLFFFFPQPAVATHCKVIYGWFYSFDSFTKRILDLDGKFQTFDDIESEQEMNKFSNLMRVVKVQ